MASWADWESWVVGGEVPVPFPFPGFGFGFGFGVIEGEGVDEGVDEAVHDDGGGGGSVVVLFASMTWSGPA